MDVAAPEALILEALRAVAPSVFAWASYSPVENGRVAHVGRRYAGEMSYLRGHTPESQAPSLEGLFNASLDELAASWDGRLDQAGYVFLPAPGDGPHVGWLDRSGSADRLLELAQMLKVGEPRAKEKLQKVAVQVFMPDPLGRLKCVVVAFESGVLVASVPPADLKELNALGATEEAKRCRREILTSMRELAISSVLQVRQAGQSFDEVVVLIVDPNDQRAAPMARALKSVDNFDYSKQHKDGKHGPMLVVFDREILRDTFKTTRPLIAKWLDQPLPAEDHVRTVCMAKAGSTQGYLKMTIKSG
jgi:hypothetical protein